MNALLPSRLRLASLVICLPTLLPLPLGAQDASPSSAGSAVTAQQQKTPVHDVTVVVSLVIDEQGVPSKIQVVKGAGAPWDQRAIEEVKAHRFKPAMRNGNPVKVSLQIKVNIKTFPATTGTATSDVAPTVKP